MTREALERFYKRYATLDDALRAVDAFDDLVSSAEQKTEIKTALRELDRELTDSIENLGLKPAKGPNGENKFIDYYKSNDVTLSRMIENIKNANKEHYELTGLVRDVDDKIASMNNLFNSEENNTTIRAVLEGSDEGRTFLTKFGEIKDDLKDIIKLRQLRYEVTIEENKLKELEDKYNDLNNKSDKTYDETEQLRALEQTVEEKRNDLDSKNRELVGFKHTVDNPARGIISASTRTKIGSNCEFTTYFRGLGKKVSEMGNSLDNITELSDAQKTEIKEGLDRISTVVKATHTNKKLQAMYTEYGLEGMKNEAGKEIPMEMNATENQNAVEQQEEAVVDPVEPDPIENGEQQPTRQPENPRTVKITKVIRGAAFAGIVAGSAFGLVAGLPIVSAAVLLGADKIGKWLSDATENIHFRSQAERIQNRASRILNRLPEEARDQFIANINQNENQNELVM